MVLLLLMNVLFPRMEFVVFEMKIATVVVFVELMVLLSIVALLVIPFRLTA